MKHHTIEEVIKDIQVLSTKDNNPVIVKGFSEVLKCVGIGTDAAVFQIEDDTRYVYKVFSEDKLETMEREKQVYEQLGESPFFPIYYGAGSNFLILSYEKGITLYDCLLKGVHIPKQVIWDVEAAREYAISKGLNPRDIHLKNILLHEGRGKLLDVSEYLKEGNDHRWTYLKKGYEDYYELIDGREVPLWLIETVRKWYNLTPNGQLDFQEFVHKLIKLFRRIG
ncbi:serine/threonine protein kinase [Robertmurraya yapensis]|uniref:Serine/threonine protein kinase n=1 Tax=Bacillus yapensis TaxID=2492960 RepID=A0A431W0T2_9BACI|nr:serine/threonine-protein kinase [Bacillus yapensis]RTR29112.1 serine/threonine protein kinase [Bacillus yapensis]TKS94717.1 serine/threonine protein kinase [Bacillus yapensis]